MDNRREEKDGGIGGNSLGRLLKTRDFRLLWGAGTLSAIGDQFDLIAFPWLVLILTGDPLSVGAIIAVGNVPTVLFMLIGGSVVDRASPRLILQISNVAGRRSGCRNRRHGRIHQHHLHDLVTGADPPKSVGARNEPAHDRLDWAVADLKRRLRRPYQAKFGLGLCRRGCNDGASFPSRWPAPRNSRDGDALKTAQKEKANGEPRSTSQSAGRDALRSLRKTCRRPPRDRATTGAVPADKRQSLPVYSQNEVLSKGTEWKNGRSLRMQGCRTTESRRNGQANRK